MPDDAAPAPPPDHLTPADPDALAQTLSFALRFDGRRHHHRADEFIAQITAEHLVKHLTASGFVVMKRPPAPAHSVAYDEKGKFIK